METVVNLLPLILLAVLFYFLVIRRVQHQQRQFREIQQSLAPGQQVVTTSGLRATVASLDDDEVVLEVAPGVHCRYARGAVGRILTSSDATPPAAGPEAGGPTGP